MTASDREVYRNGAGARAFAIRRNFGECPPMAIVDCNPDGSTAAAAFVPPHEVPKAARALYEAAGLPVPDLPDIPGIPDPELVEALAEDIESAAIQTAVATPAKFGVAENRRIFARELLARGWGRTS